MADDKRIVSYHDATLHLSDLIDLSTASFLSDRVIHFFFTHLSLSNPNSILLLPPSLSFLLSNLPIPLPELDLPSKTLILFPVNDNDDTALPNGGSHWSLLVYHKPTNQFIHHDSNRGMNSSQAQTLYRAVRGMVGGDGRFVEGFTPKQMNGFDCGVYVMAIAKVVCEWERERERKGEEMWFEKVRREVDEESVSGLRREVLGLVTSLMHA